MPINRAEILRRRREVLPGYPINAKFKSIQEVDEYLSTFRIVCLLCGKEYKRIGTHLQSIHEMEPDEYREMFGIPYTYGLCCPDTKQAHHDAIQKRMKEGFRPAAKTGDAFNELLLYPKRENPQLKTHCERNLKGHTLPKRPLTINDQGEFETFTQRRTRLTTKRGTEEYHKKMVDRLQCQPDVAGKRLGDYWRGRKQTKEHIEKRMLRINESRTKERKTTAS